MHLRTRSLALSLTTTCCLLAPPVQADPPIRTTAPNTQSCPQSLTPPPPESTSEQLRPGQTSPQVPPPVDNEFGTCEISAGRGFVTPATTAAAWLVFDLDNGDVLATKDPHGRYRPASVIKVLLALVALEELDLQDRYTASYEDENQEGSRVGLVQGVSYTNEQLLYGLLLNSGNDAAHALATQLGRDEATLAKVNAKAKELGAVDTYAASYSGLDAPGMMTSAVDLARFYYFAWQNPTFAKMVNTDYVDYPGTEPSETYQVWNDNGLFLNDEHGIGGKTGYTDDAHHTFVGAKEVGSRRLAAVILDTTIDLGRPWQQAQSLIDASATIPAIGTLKPTDRSVESSEPTPTAAPEAQGPSRRDNPLWLLPSIILAVAVLATVTWKLGRRN